MIKSISPIFFKIVSIFRTQKNDQFEKKVFFVCFCQFFPLSSQKIESLQSIFYFFKMFRSLDLDMHIKRQSFSKCNLEWRVHMIEASLCIFVKKNGQLINRFLSWLKTIYSALSRLDKKLWGGGKGRDFPPPAQLWGGGEGRDFPPPAQLKCWSPLIK